MTSRKYFHYALFLPIVFALIGAMIPGLRFLLIFFLVGCIPYLAVIALMSYLIDKSRSLMRLAWLSVATPFIFAFTFSIFWAIAEGNLLMFDSILEFLEYSYLIGMLPFMFSGFYIAIAWLIWLIGIGANWVSNEFTP